MLQRTDTARLKKRAGEVWEPPGVEPTRRRSRPARAETGRALEPAFQRMPAGFQEELMSNVVSLLVNFLEEPDHCPERERPHDVLCDPENGAPEVRPRREPGFARDFGQDISRQKL
jgi:hypothetical protein